MTWSYDLLDDADRDLLRRLSVFTDGFTLEAATVIGADPPRSTVDVLDSLARLAGRRPDHVRRGGGHGALPHARDRARFRFQPTRPSRSLPTRAQPRHVLLDDRRSYRRVEIRRSRRIGQARRPGARQSSCRHLVGIRQRSGPARHVDRDQSLEVLLGTAERRQRERSLGSYCARSSSSTTMMTFCSSLPARSSRRTTSAIARQGSTPPSACVVGSARLATRLVKSRLLVALATSVMDVDPRAAEALLDEAWARGAASTAIDRHPQQLRRAVVAHRHRSTTVPRCSSDSAMSCGLLSHAPPTAAKIEAGVAACSRTMGACRPPDRDHGRAPGMAERPERPAQ